MQEITTVGPVPVHGRKSPRRRWMVLVAVFVGLLALEAIVSAVAIHGGVNTTGDEPSYIIEAQSLEHFRFEIRPVINADLSGHRFKVFPIGTPASAVEQWPGPHGVVSPFEPGMGLLILPFVAVGSHLSEGRGLEAGALTGMLVLTTLGMLFLHRRVTGLTQLSPRGQLILAILFASPALLVAMTQTYPDLPSGILLAIGLTEVALIEKTRSVTWTNRIAILVTAALLPWLQIKNTIAALVLLVAFVVVAWRDLQARRGVIIVSAVVLLLVCLLFAYNAYYMGHLLGLPEQRPRATSRGLEYTLGLLFDRDQGLFVQVPFCLFGLLGLWLARKKIPIAVGATVIGLLTILLLNGTYISNPYGGGSLAGRFMWTLAPSLLGWTAVVLARWPRTRTEFSVVLVVVSVAWLYQAEPLLANRHTYYNPLAYSPHPLIWPTWWPGLTRFLPAFYTPGRYLGAPSYGLALEVALAGMLLILVGVLSRPSGGHTVGGNRTAAKQVGQRAQL